jgi:NAD+ kinase
MIAICPNPYRDADLDYSRRALEMLSGEGFECAICPVFAEEGEDILPRDVSYRSVKDLGDDCTLLIVIGGDGTILSVVRTLRGRSIPVLGVNLGTKGFMTALEAEDFNEILSAAKGRYRLSERMMIDVAIERGGKVIYTDLALNDAVIHGYGECINITAYCNDDKMTAYSGDGVIVSTPTGSTGYSLSAGGPIVEPEAEAFILTPICAHSISAKPFVIGSQKTISITTEKLHTRRAYLSVDGNSVMDLCSGDRMIVRRSEHRTLMVRIHDKTFFETAYEKL